MKKALLVLVALCLCVAVIEARRPQHNQLQRFFHRASSQVANPPGGCTKDTKRCTGWKEKGQDAPPCCQAKLRELAHKVSKVLQKNTVDYWIEAGTLLGSFRFGDLIPWDTDIDFGLHQKDLTKLLSITQWPGTFQFKTVVPNQMYRVEYSATNTIHVDLYVWREEGKGKTKTLTRTFMGKVYRVPSAAVFPLITCPFANKQLKCPKDGATFLKKMYHTNCFSEPVYQYCPGDCPSRDKNKDRQMIVEGLKKWGHEDLICPNHNSQSEAAQTNAGDDGSDKGGDGGGDGGKGDGKGGKGGKGDKGKENGGNDPSGKGPKSEGGDGKGNAANTGKDKQDQPEGTNKSNSKANNDLTTQTSPPSSSSATPSAPGPAGQANYAGSV
eukprot:GILI01004383.1.p1 GENE.GILI01004383.1~~GILI01004383.1.p1  ORF type:complete len:383 (+),score=138.91 GILI01004383.1:93-1241(+)